MVGDLSALAAVAYPFSLRVDRARATFSALLPYERMPCTDMKKKTQLSQQPSTTVKAQIARLINIVSRQKSIMNGIAQPLVPPRLLTGFSCNHTIYSTEYKKFLSLGPAKKKKRKKPVGWHVLQSLRNYHTKRAADRRSRKIQTLRNLSERPVCKNSTPCHVAQVTVASCRHAYHLALLSNIKKGTYSASRSPFTPPLSSVSSTAP